MLNTSDEELRSELLRKLVAQSLLGALLKMLCRQLVSHAQTFFANLTHQSMVFSLQIAALGPIKRISDHFEPSALPIRFLPHGNVANLYLLFTAWCKAKSEEPSCRTTFYQVYRVWSQCLRFHKSQPMRFAKRVQRSGQKFIPQKLLGWCLWFCILYKIVSPNLTNCYRPVFT